MNRNFGTLCALTGAVIAGVRGLSVAALALLLAACVVQAPTRPQPVPPRPAPVPVPVPVPAPIAACAQPPLPPAARSVCAPGVRPVGVLAVLSDAVCRNNHAAINGERVCEGDTITTSPSGAADVLPDGDHDSDSVHVAEGTDPRFSWTQSGCLSVDGYVHGRIVATALRRCMVIRTPDTLMLLVSGRVQFQVAGNTGTRVLPLRGSLTKLQPLSQQQVYSLTAAQLMQFAAAPALQPQLQSINVYSRHAVTQPAVRVAPEEIRRIDNSLLRRAIIPPPREIPR